MEFEKNRPAGSDAAWADLLELPGVEFAWTRISQTGAERLVVTPGAPPREGAGAWAQLHTQLALRMAEELDLGIPKVTVTVHDQRLLVLGRAEGGDVALVLRDPGSAGIALLRVRQWIERGGSE